MKSFLLSLYSNKKITKIVLFSVVLFSFLVSSFFIYRRTYYGFVCPDEAFYISSTYRIFQGDLLFQHEWNLSQLSIFPLIPILKSALLINNNSFEGVFILLRIFYTSIQILVALFIFIKLKKWSFWGSFFSAISFMLFTPYNVMAFSYKTLPVLCLSVSFVILATTETNSFIMYFLSGVLFANAVLCSPLLIIVYPFYVILYLISRKDCVSIFTKSSILPFSLGAFLICIAFFIFVFTNQSLSDLISVLPNIFYDPEHPFTLSKIFTFFTEIWNSCSIKVGDSLIPISKIYFSLFFIFFILVFYKKKKGSNSPFYFLVFIIITFLYFLFLIKYGNYLNLIIFPINLLAIPAFILSSNSKIKKLFLYIWIPGFIFSFLQTISSNQGFLETCYSCSVCLIASVLIVFIYVSDIPQEHTILKIFNTACIVIFLLCQIFATGKYRYLYPHWDAARMYASYYQPFIEGTQKEIRAGDAFIESYDNVLDDLKQIENDNSIHSVLYFYGSPWFYLETPSKLNSSFTSQLWNNDCSYNIHQFMSYYKNSPEKIPDFVYFSYSGLYGIDFNENEYNLYKNSLFPDYMEIEMKDGIALKREY